MNSITVTAHGSPDSLARKIQANPQLAIELIQAVRQFDSIYEFGFMGRNSKSPQMRDAANKVEDVLVRLSFFERPPAPSADDHRDDFACYELQTNNIEGDAQ